MVFCRFINWLRFIFQFNLLFSKPIAMTEEEIKAKRTAYQINLRNNLSRFQREKKRLKLKEYNAKRNKITTPEKKKIRSIKNRLYYQQNREKILVKNAEYREKHKEKNRAYQAQYRKQQKEKNHAD
jgi:hypothetical protein